MKSKQKILITGCAGFIGMHLSEKLLNLGYEIIGIDNLNDYYDVNLKLKRLSILEKRNSFKFFKLDICDLKNLEEIFEIHAPIKVVNLAAQAGVVDIV